MCTSLTPAATRTDRRNGGRFPSGTNVRSGRRAVGARHVLTHARRPRRHRLPTDIAQVPLPRIKGSTGYLYNDGRDFRTWTNRAVGTSASCRRSHSRGAACRSRSDQERAAPWLLLAVRRSFVSVRWVIQVRLDGRLCATQPARDLGDRYAFLVAVVTRELRGATTLTNSIAHLTPPGLRFRRLLPSQQVILPHVLDSLARQKGGCL